MAEIDPLLRTKFHMPRLRPNYIERPRLTARLSEGRRQGHCLVLVSAPPGYGKSALLSEWVGLQDSPVAWLSLDADDNDPAVFWPHIAGSIGLASPPLCASLLPYLKATPRPFSKAVATLLLNDFAQQQDTLTLVLDDFHHITDADIQSGLELLLNHCPQQLMLVIGTRADPALPVARLRAQGKLTELRALDMALRLDETDEFVSKQVTTKLSNHDIGALHERTEGWAAGLELAVLSLAGRADPHAFVTAFSGSHTHVLGYLIEEAIGHMPADLRQFLLRTSILDQLSAPLCEFVTGDSHSRRHLENIRRQNLFLVALEEQDAWFRYHHLFADLLRLLLMQEQPEQVSLLHRRAADWYLRHFLPDPAIRYARQGGDLALVASMIRANWEATVHSGNVAVVQRWFELLPDALIDEDLTLLLAKCWTVHLSGQSEQIHGLLSKIEPQIVVPQRPDRYLHTSFLMLKSIVARHDGEIEESVGFAMSAVESAPVDNANLQGVAWNLLAAVQYVADGIEDSIASFGKGISLARRGGNLLSMSVSTFYRTALLRRQGRLHEAETACRSVLTMADADKRFDVPAVGLVHIALADLLLERNQIDDARVHLMQGIEQAKTGGFIEEPTHGNFVRAKLALACDDLAAAHSALDDADRLLQWLDEPRLLAELHMMRIILHLRAGDIRLAESALKTLKRAVDETRQADTVRLIIEAKCRVQIVAGRGQDALPQLVQIKDQADATGSEGFLVRLMLLSAIGHHQTGESQAAIDEFESALQLGTELGFVRLFLNEGSAIVPLLVALKHRPSLPPALSTAIERLWTNLTLATTVPPPTETLFEPLSPREVEIARLVSAGFSNKQIAAELIISVNTVKTHAAHLYAKLGVNNRTQAAARLRELHLDS